MVVEGDAAVVEGVRRAGPPVGPPCGGTVWSVIPGAGAYVIPRVRTVGYRRPPPLGDCDSMADRCTSRPRRSHRELANDWIPRGGMVCRGLLTGTKVKDHLRHGYRQRTIDKL
jgi:hypothetical protein